MKQILIVEDDSFLNKMLANNLTADGYSVTSALNARTAAEALRQREFDLVVTVRWRVTPLLHHFNICLKSSMQEQP